MYLVFGGHGRLAKRIASLAPDDFRLSEADIRVPMEILEAIEHEDVEAVINAAAITDLERCERAPSMALDTNAVAASLVAVMCASLDIPLLHISTDYVFGGYWEGPYKVGDPEYPINAYGATKLWGERGVLSLHKSAKVARVAWLYGVEYPSKAPMQAVTQTYKVRGKDDSLIQHSAFLWDDYYGSPSYVEHVAAKIVSEIAYLPLWPRIVHIAPPEGPVSWYELMHNMIPEVRPARGRMQSSVARPSKGGLVPSREFELPSYNSGLKDFMDEYGRQLGGEPAGNPF